MVSKKTAVYDCLLKSNIEVFSVIWAPQGTHNIEIWPSVSVAGYKLPKWGYITCSYDATEMSSRCTEKTSHNEQIVVRTDHWWFVGREKCHTLLIIASLSCLYYRRTRVYTFIVFCNHRIQCTSSKNAVYFYIGS
jgi:hypothetical protein